MMTTRINLGLLNDPRGGPTWVSNNASLRPGVLDLVWVDHTLGAYDGLQVDTLGRGQSDHAVLTWTMPFQQELDMSPRITKVSEASYAYCLAVSKVLQGLNHFEYTSREDVENAGEVLQRHLDRCYDDHAAAPKPSAKSKSWWSGECTTAHKTVRALRYTLRDLCRQRRVHAASHPRLPNAHGPDPVYERISDTIRATQAQIDSALAHTRAAVRRAKRDYYDSKLSKLESWQIWDPVHWTRPRRLEA